jgi:hypothetical protein
MQLQHWFRVERKYSVRLEMAYEDSMLRDAVQIHRDSNWGAIAALVPDRTKVAVLQPVV